MADNPRHTFDTIMRDEALRGERLCHGVRWVFLGLAAIMVLAMLLLDRYRAAALASCLFLVGMAAYNFQVGRRLEKGRLSPWLRFVPTTLDVLLITAYNCLMSVYDSPFGLSTIATLFVYPIILLYVALRLDKWLLLYTLALILLCFNLPYFLLYTHMDPNLVRQVASSDPVGHLFKSAFILFFGLSLLFIDQTIRRLIAKQADLFQAQQADEERHLATLEAQVQQRTAQLVNTNQELRQALSEVKTLSGLLPICSHCKKIRDDGGYWQEVERYVASHSQADFSHGICPECVVKYYPEMSHILKELPANLDKDGEVT